MFKNFKKLITQIKEFFFSINTIIKFNNIKPKFIFFSEGKSYQKFSKPIINVLNKEFPNQVYYLSIDKYDKIKEDGIKNYFINYFLINFFFNNIKAENLFLTITDLDNHSIKKTNKIDKYIYYFHSPNSTTKCYTNKAFDNYDIILCNGNFQIEEIRAREKLRNLKKKKLIPTGYFYLDSLINKTDYKRSDNEILIAPSWNYNHKSFINENFIELIDILINKNFKVIFRPHPEHYKRSKKVLKKIQDKFIKKKFIFDNDSENVNSMEKARCLITDSSGIAIEYIVAFKRPVLYFDELDKIHNNEFNDYANLKTIDKSMKDNFGYIFKKENFESIDLIISEADQNLKKKISNLDYFIKKNFANYGKTKDYFKKISKKIFNHQSP
jgi:YidC/Oxa1 family membrane protein insertase